MNSFRPFNFQIVLIATLSCNLNTANKLILEQKVDPSQADFAILYKGPKTPHLNHLMLLSANENKDLAKLALIKILNKHNFYVHEYAMINSV